MLPNYFFGHAYNTNCKLCNLLKTASVLSKKEAEKYANVIQGLHDKKKLPHQPTWMQLKETDLYKRLMQTK
jgi:hypothetical protein